MHNVSPERMRTRRRTGRGDWGSGWGVQRTSWSVRRVASVGVVAATLLVSACSSDPPDPEPLAEGLAEALAGGQFDGVALAGASVDEAATQFEELVGDLADVERTVEVRALLPDPEDDAVYEVTFDVTWHLAADGGGETDEDAENTDGGNTEGGNTEGGNAGTEDADDATSEDSSGEADSSSGRGESQSQVWTYTTTGRLELVETGEEEQWQAVWSPELLHPDLTDGDQLRMSRESAPRADILGAGGTALVTDRDVFRVGIDKTRFDDGVTDDELRASARELADVVGVDAESFAERVVAAGEAAFVEAITFRRADAEPLLSEISNVTGGRALDDTMPLAPTREFARPLLGTVGDATAEIIDESGGLIQQGDQVGLSGMQHIYDAQLRGTAGVTVELVPADGEPTVLYENEPVPGEDLVTTLDRDLQIHAESVLADVGPPSGIVAIEASTGAVRAAASGPGGDGYSTATLGQYAPGSTFKVATALALLRAGVSPEDAVACPETLTVDGREFGNYSGYPNGALGDITLATAVAESCNTAFMGERDRISQQDIADAAASLGVGHDVDLGYPAFLGSVPAEADGTAHAAAMIGQGEVLASPLAMATVAASVAAGETVLPRLVGEELPAGATGDAVPVTGDEAAQLEAMMREAVDYGSASFLQGVPGEPVAAKTGTAEYGSGDEAGLHAWMIAIQGDLAVAVFVEQGESGSETAGPLLEAFLTLP